MSNVRPHINVEIYRASPKLRQALVLAGAGGIVGGVAIYWLFRQWAAGLAELPRAAALSQLGTALGWLMAAQCLGLVALAAYLWRVGKKVVASSQWPFPGARVLRDTVLLRGAPAQRRGRLLQGIGAAVLALAVVAAVLMWRVYAALAASAA